MGQKRGRVGGAWGILADTLRHAHVRKHTCGSASARRVGSLPSLEMEQKPPDRRGDLPVGFEKVVQFPGQPKMETCGLRHRRPSMLTLARGTRGAVG